MSHCRPSKLILILAFVLVASLPLVAQTATADANLQAAELAVSAAEQAGAPLYAKELYDEAQSRLVFARTNLSGGNAETRRIAGLRALEALSAAQAAEARARLVQNATEARNLSADIQRWGGTTPELMLNEPSGLPMNRQGNSAERVAIAERAIGHARTAGAEAVAADMLAEAEQNVRTAKTILRNQKQSDSADYLAFNAEMLARRAEYMALSSGTDRMLPSLRLERTRLANEASMREADAERRRREEAERQAAQLRERLANESTARKLQAEEANRLRQQVLARDQQVRAQLEEDRRLRIEAEARLDELRKNYEAAIARAGSASEVDMLRRQLEDQRLALSNIQAQEIRSEESMRAEIARLQQALEDERRRGVAGASTREAELLQRQSELQRMSLEREQSEQRRADMERAHQQAIAEAQQRLMAAEAESNQLRAEVQQRDTELQRKETELQRAREELARRDAEVAERTARMEAALAEIAETRRDNRGLILTLPGLLFDVGQSTLKPGARNVLGRVADQLKANERVRVTVEGHTDSTGSDELNQRLSEQRAAAVRDYLTSQGIASDRLSIQGLGKNAPIATNDTPAGRQQNRRVELIFVEQPAS